MSILDFAENPKYQLVAVALSEDDVAVIFGVKKDKLRPVLEIAIEMLQAELDKLPPANAGPVTRNKRARKETPQHEPPAHTP